MKSLLSFLILTLAVTSLTFGSFPVKSTSNEKTVQTKEKVSVPLKKDVEKRIVEPTKVSKKDIIKEVRNLKKISKSSNSNKSDKNTPVFLIILLILLLALLIPGLLYWVLVALVIWLVLYLLGLI